MLQSGAGACRDAPGGEHDLWLAMKSAHGRYRNAAALLDDMKVLPPGGVPGPERQLEIEAMAGEERAAFENYIEARLQLSEFLLAKISPKPPEAKSPVKAVPVPGSGFGLSRVATLAVLAAFLFPTAFGFGYFLHERKRTRELETARDTATAALNQAKAEVQALGGKVEELKAANRSTAATAARLQNIQARKDPPRSFQSRKDQAKTTPARKNPTKAKANPKRIARNHEEVLELQRLGDRTYREFALTPWQPPARIGPIGLTVLSVDQKRKSFDLAISVGSLESTKKRVSLYEPVWIDLHGRPKAVEVVINGFEGDRVAGYLSEPKYPRMTWWEEFTQIATAMLP
jgi:hypothetical protein